jgi:septal ring factor EnvC (AmiA/AmiB activator)
MRALGHRVCGNVVLVMVLAIFMLAATTAGAQSSRDTERKLDQIKRELKDVAGQRRQIEGQRSDASRQLRTVDEQLGHSSRALIETDGKLTQQQSTLVALQQRRTTLQSTLGDDRRELATLLRAAYTVNRAAPLQLMLAQDRVADAARVLTWHRYLQRDRAQRIATLTSQLHELGTVEQRITQTRKKLAAEKNLQGAQLVQQQKDRVAQARTLAQLDQKYRDRADREQALGRDAKGLEQVLAQLRAAAAREAARKAAVARAEREAARVAAKAASSTHGAIHDRPRPPPPVIANAKPLQVGGLSWPVSGALLAGFGGTLPDGGVSEGVLIGAPTGTPVKAVADGKVVFADWMNGYGLIVIVDHGNGAMSLYAHNEALLRDVGASVKRGDAIASVGNSGGKGRPGVYFELRRNGHPVNPAEWLQRR